MGENAYRYHLGTFLVLAAAKRYHYSLTVAQSSPSSFKNYICPSEVSFTTGNLACVAGEISRASAPVLVAE